MISILVAVSDNGIIGNSNDLPWYLPADLKHFKQLTLGSTVVMGRKTWDSIVSRLGHALPGRENIVITRSPTTHSDPEAVFVNSIEAALDKASKNHIFIIGGAQIYQLGLDYAQTIYQTEVHTAVNGDVAFPEINHRQWTEISRIDHEADDKNPYDYSFVELERKASAKQS